MATLTMDADDFGWLDGALFVHDALSSDLDAGVVRVTLLATSGPPTLATRRLLWSDFYEDLDSRTLRIEGATSLDASKGKLGDAIGIVESVAITPNRLRLQLALDGFVEISGSALRLSVEGVPAHAGRRRLRRYLGGATQESAQWLEVD